MEPLGTITKYYSFIDEESKSVLESLMAESVSYYDFVKVLSAFVLENEVPVNLAYLAAVQAWWSRTKENMSLIQKKYRSVPCVRPWGYLHASIESDQAEYHDAVVKAIEEAMDTPLEDWMETELHLLHAFYHWPYHGDIPGLVEPLERAKGMIKANAALTCFEPLVWHFEGEVKRREGDSKGAIADYQRGQQVAVTYGDSLYKYMNMLGMGLTLISLNVQQSSALYEELYDLAQDLQVPYLLAEVSNDSALAFETAGEYDLAVSCHLEDIKLMGSSDMPSLILSRIYSTLYEGQLALEWADRSFNRAGNLRFPISHIRKAWALAVSNRLEEAERSLDTASPLVMKGGSELWLGYYYHISGVIEFKRGNLLDASDLLEQALEISERLPNAIIRNIALLGLAEVEVAMASQSKVGTKNVMPGMWLSRLERHAIERDLPGIRMQAALLKSELYQNHGQLKDARAILLDALDITDSLGVKTLRNRISARIQALDRLMLDEELVS